MSNAWKTFVAQALVPLVILSGIGVPVGAATRQVNCDSNGMRRSYCAVGSHKGIRLVSSRGAWPCKEGRTWGSDGNGIWVDQNCKGTFAVDEGSRDNTAAIVAGVVGLGVLAAIAANQNRQEEPPPPNYYPPGTYVPPPGYVPPPDANYGFPTWMIGRFHGYAYRDHQDLTVDIGPSGRVVSRGNGPPSYGRLVPGGQLVFDNGVRFYMQPAPGGARLTQVQDRHHVIALTRER